MPEGDSIHHAARRLRGALLGGPLDRVRTPSPRTRPRGWERRLAGRALTAIDARGKHLLLRFEGDLVLHSHLRMSGRWTVRDAGGRYGPGAWIVLGRGDRDGIQLGGPFLELRTAAQVAADPRLRALGPDLCADGPLDVDRILLRLRQDDPTRAVGDALLDQRTVAGIGNVWKSEGCHAAGIDPWRPLAAVSDEELRAILDAIVPGIRRCAREGTHLRPRRIYGQAGRPCPRCGTTIMARGMGDDNRTTWWCPGCQR
ncbi:DNA-formamidopyrimidine glycosylase family protein [Patulibacter defluvii]|uniref:DNA-formamidopyrimidine glycosylase family protein n=1 Tax=Patulibacter defluvii TaxID=3095358 RepID=UPI002A74CB1B|nr:DNA-formamidopyrimidine glycosylase family protein [Patulibacter sp. DM4]